VAGSARSSKSPSNPLAKRGKKRKLNKKEEVWGCERGKRATKPPQSRKEWVTGGGS